MLCSISNCRHPFVPRLKAFLRITRFQKRKSLKVSRARSTQFNTQDSIDYKNGRIIADKNTSHRCFLDLYHLPDSPATQRRIGIVGTAPLIMPATKASGADATPKSNAKSRDHNQGNQDRKYTIEQKTAVIRVRSCSPTAFYEILSLERSASDAEIKKAYRKLSLLTHPDKNGYDGADEAFKCESPSCPFGCF